MGLDEKLRIVTASQKNWVNSSTTMMHRLGILARWQIIASSLTMRIPSMNFRRGVNQKWSINSTLLSVDERTAQATSNSFHTSCLSSQEDGQSARRERDVRTTPSKDNGTQPEVPMNKGHRQKPRKSRAAKEAEEGDSRGNRIFTNPIPLHPWTYYPPPTFVIMMPFPFAPMLGPQTQCTNSNSRNVANKTPTTITAPISISVKVIWSLRAFPLAYRQFKEVAENGAERPWPHVKGDTAFWTSRDLKASRLTVFVSLNGRLDNRIQVVSKILGIVRCERICHQSVVSISPSSRKYCVHEKPPMIFWCCMTR